MEVQYCVYAARIYNFVTRVEVRQPLSLGTYHPEQQGFKCLTSEYLVSQTGLFRTTHLMKACLFENKRNLLRSVAATSDCASADNLHPSFTFVTS